jgi:hypothetical protein
VKEHYRIEVPASAARLITQGHAQACLQRQELKADRPGQGVRLLLAEMDGTNVPVVKIPEKVDHQSS